MSLSRIGVDETAVQIGTDWYWLYAAIDLDSLYLLNVDVFTRHSTDPAAAFLTYLTEKCDVAEMGSLVNAFGSDYSVSIRPERPGRVQQPKPHRKLSRFD